MMDMSAALTPMHIPKQIHPCQVPYRSSKSDRRAIPELCELLTWDGERYCSPTKLTTNQLCAASAKMESLDHVQAHATSHLVPCPMYDECSLRVVRKRRFRSTMASWIQSGSTLIGLSSLERVTVRTYGREVFVFPTIIRQSWS